MLLKEKGYDEFLAQKIQKGLEDSQAGRVISLEESKARVQKLLERKATELEQSKQGAIYG